jgi:hypothetical protein
MTSVPDPLGSVTLGYSNPDSFKFYMNPDPTYSSEYHVKLKLVVSPTFTCILRKNLLTVMWLKKPVLVNNS